MTGLQKIIADLDWRGPNDKAMGHVVLTREEAEGVLAELRNDAAHRDWEGRWRDEYAENKKLKDALAYYTDKEAYGELKDD